GGVELETRSQVPVGLAQNAADGRIAMATSMPNSRGAPMCMRVTWLTPPAPRSDRLVEAETKWTPGEQSGNNCTTPPVVDSSGDGQLFLSPPGWPDANGQMTSWRTRQVSNQALDEGWLTCMLYDVWTRTRCAVGFADGPKGAIFAFRWDSGDYNDWK